MGELSEGFDMGQRNGMRERREGPGIEPMHGLGVPGGIRRPADAAATTGPARGQPPLSNPPAAGAAAATPPAVRLTPREHQVLALMADGLSNKQIGRRLDISFHGAKRLVASVLAKLDSPTRTVAVAKALREGIYDQYQPER
jgi:DNA-binding CsgD family transcriptional regulator